jgi:hypothetical protein
LVNGLIGWLLDIVKALTCDTLMFHSKHCPCIFAACNATVYHFCSMRFRVAKCPGYDDDDDVGVPPIAAWKAG